MLTEIFSVCAGTPRAGQKSNEQWGKFSDKSNFVKMKTVITTQIRGII